ncbi:phage head morphogenesis protein [[Haemophilus] ducreyi]|uniref:Phage head morphogenesis protein n=2 Tax=Haemophilus ducreyi TaxID=730 RepID=Q7VNJ9_HAEDU|nr:phage minor head protein [[Haemophilus] ducreyi]AAP95460.1 hypothetical protein HD_0515 [[Haemophilus] ducreyi 35000HP]AKO30561.1 head morphogenesis protein [[Haemophilus] ducreyi]AKO31998.1 head morphogenesis protein [[Haemophilus] ducreyi]AKO33453.1 head morphogenesis protein [[Haemophilus] ducreyi]AKO34900.1 head morphogenesis protein [[Haemophilus] ducreyi]
MPKELSFAIGLEPTQAIEYLKQKKMLAEKVLKKELHESALARATTIARLTSLEMTKDIYASMETARREGKSFNTWKKGLVDEMERKGWVAGRDKKLGRGLDGTLLADPKTGEYFGTPRRLNTIYRVNMQAAYSGARYQRMMDNVDNRPYWKYSAVSDSRTRPAHLALNGRVYRYDAPFWATFYPPNGFNCRCTVIALNARDLARQDLTVGDSSDFLVETQRLADKFDNTEKTIGFKLPNGTVRVTDKGFDYNVGRLTYRPNLDLYPDKLAHQFAKVEMTGGEFEFTYQKIEKQITQIKQALGVDKKLSVEQMVKVRDSLTRNFKFAAGVLSAENKALMQSKTATVWLSDDTLIKQINSRDGQEFGISEYAKLPDVLRDAEHILQTNRTYEFYKQIDGNHYLVIIKVLQAENEIFVQSFRLVGEKEWLKMLKKKAAR